MNLGDLGNYKVKKKAAPTTLGDLGDYRLKVDQGASDFEPESEPVERLKVIGNAINEAIPFSSTLNRAADYVDLPGGTGQNLSSDEKIQRREDYSKYLKSKYPKEADFAGNVAQGAMLPLRFMAGAVSPVAAASQAYEPIVNQLIGENRSVVNPENWKESAINSVPIAIEAATHIPGGMAKYLEKMKYKNEADPSLKAYKESPNVFDAYEQKTGGVPREALISKVRNAVGEAASAKQGRMDDLTAAMNDARQSRGEAQRNIADQQRNAVVDAQQATTIGADEGEAAKEAVKNLHHTFGKTVQIRDGILEHEGTTHSIEPINKMFDKAHARTFDTQSRESLLAAKQRINNLSDELGDSGQLPSRAMDVFRQELQRNVPYGTGQRWTPAQVEMHDIAKKINNMLDDAIPINNSARGQIQKATKNYQAGLDLLGGNQVSNISSLKSSLSDPMKRQVLDELNLPEIQDAAAKVDAAKALKEAKARGIKPNVPAQADREKAIRDYLEAKQGMAKERANQLPFTPEGAESAINTGLSGNVRPNIGTYQNLGKYANTLHPGGPDAFWDEYHVNKVLHDLHAADVRNGSSGAVLCGALGAALGEGLEHLTKVPYLGTAGAALGASGGSYLDYHTSQVLRDLIKKNETSKTLQSLVRPTYGAINRILNDHNE